jgi:hypothetical protein
LRQLLRRAWDEQQRFPLKVVTALSQQLAAQGLQFFKVNKSITHVAVARPHYLDLEATPVSEGVKRIVDYINTHTGCTRRQLIEALAPSAAPAVAPATIEPPESPAVSRSVAPVPLPSSTSATPPSADLHEPTPEQTIVIADLHWLIHQGHVIEFANGRIETARKPIPKPPRPAPKAAQAAAQPAAAPDQTIPISEATIEAEAAAQPEAIGQSNLTNQETAPPGVPNDTALSSSVEAQPAASLAPRTDSADPSTP